MKSYHFMAPIFFLTGIPMHQRNLSLSPVGARNGPPNRFFMAGAKSAAESITHMPWTILWVWMFPLDFKWSLCCVFGAYILITNNIYEIFAIWKLKITVEYLVLAVQRWNFGHFVSCPLPIKIFLHFLASTSGRYRLAYLCRERVPRNITRKVEPVIHPLLLLFPIFSPLIMMSLRCNCKLEYFRGTFMMKRFPVVGRCFVSSAYWK